MRVAARGVTMQKEPRGNLRSEPGHLRVTGILDAAREPAWTHRAVSLTKKRDSDRKRAARGQRNSRARKPRPESFCVCALAAMSRSR